MFGLSESKLLRIAEEDVRPNSQSYFYIYIPSICQHIRPNHLKLASFPSCPFISSIPFVEPGELESVLGINFGDDIRAEVLVVQVWRRHWDFLQALEQLVELVHNVQVVASRHIEEKTGCADRNDFLQVADDLLHRHLNCSCDFQFQVLHGICVQVRGSSFGGGAGGVPSSAGWVSSCEPMLVANV